MLSAPPLALATQAALAATALVATTAVLDCNPTLFWWDQWRTISERYVRNSIRRPEATRTIWIIGASSGIGQELACQLAEESCSFAPSSSQSTDGASEVQHHDPPPPLHLILSSRKAEKLDQLALDLASPTCRVTPLPLDVTNNDELQAAVDTLRTSNDEGQIVQLNTVVLNAGFGHLTPALETLPSTAEAVWRGNALWPMVLLPLLLNNTTSPSSLFRQTPHIVATASVASYIPVPLSSTYCAAKHALLGYLRSLQAETNDVCIQIVSPGPVETYFHQNHQQGKTTAASKPSRLKMPVQRCAQLMRRVMEQRKGRGGEYWIASQPLLSLLYLNQWFPGLVRFVTGKVGPKRIDLWRRGKDLYDPDSWRE